MAKRDTLATAQADVHMRDCVGCGMIAHVHVQPWTHLSNTVKQTNNTMKKTLPQDQYFTGDGAWGSGLWGMVEGALT